MNALIQRIRRDASYLGHGIIKVDSFLNHQVDASLMAAIGREFVERFAALGVDTVSRVLTAEVSGIPPALATAGALGVPMVYARKHESATLTGNYHQAETVSRTRGNRVQLRVDSRFLVDSDRVLIIDDFLATGHTLNALVRIIQQSGAQLLGIGCVIEKPAERGRETIGEVDAPVLSLARLGWDNEQVVVLD